MNKLKKMLFLSAAAIGILFNGCVKDFSTAVDPAAQSATGTQSLATTVKSLPGYIFITKDSVLTYQLRATNAANLSAVSVDLYTDGDLIQSADLYDDGKTSNGDTVAGDSLFTGIGNLFTSMPNGTYRVVYKLLSKNGSENICAEQSFFFVGKNTAPVISNLTCSIPDTIVVNDNIPFLFTLKVSDADGANDIVSVPIEVVQASGDPLLLYLMDDGKLKDATAHDGIYSLGLAFGPENTKGTYHFKFYAKDRAGAHSDTLKHDITLQ